MPQSAAARVQASFPQRTQRSTLKFIRPPTRQQPRMRRCRMSNLRFVLAAAAAAAAAAPLLTHLDNAGVLQPLGQLRLSQCRRRCRVGLALSGERAVDELDGHHAGVPIAAVDCSRGGGLGVRQWSVWDR